MSHRDALRRERPFGWVDSRFPVTMGSPRSVLEVAGLMLAPGRRGGKVVSGIVTNLLAGVGFNNVLVKLGLAKQPPQGRQTPAAIVGLVALAFIVLLASVAVALAFGLSGRDMAARTLNEWRAGEAQDRPKS